MALSFTPSAATAAGISPRSCVISTSYSATAKVSGWLPTDVYDATKTTPNGWYIGGFHTYNTNFLYSGSTAVSASAVANAANAAFAETYATKSSYYIDWDWSKTLSQPGLTARLLVLHRADKITFTKYQNNANCTTTTTTGLVAYVPLSTDLQSTYCSIVDISPFRSGWSSTCVD